MENPQKDFFISYNSADVFWGKWIAWKLEEAGFTTIIQAWDFLPGQDFVLGMQEATKARQTIAILSENYLKADFTQPEWSAAFVQDPRGVKRTLIPILVRPCKLEGFFATRIYIDFTDIDEDVALQRLLDGIRLDRAKPTTAPAFPGKSSSSSNQGKAGAAPLAESASLNAEPAFFPKDMPPVTRTIETFIVFDPDSAEDKNYLKILEKQLEYFKQQGRLATWNSSKILPGREVAPEIEKYWNRSQLILLLISADSMADPKTNALIQRAIGRHKDGTAHVIPILLRPCLSDFDKTFNVLPSNKKFVSSWNKRDEAYLDIALGIREVIDELLRPD